MEEISIICNLQRGNSSLGPQRLLGKALGLGPPAPGQGAWPLGVPVCSLAKRVDKDYCPTYLLGLLGESAEAMDGKEALSCKVRPQG